MLDVMIITYNEAVNLPHCLAALRGWAGRVFVIDSGSTDGTQEIARAYGAHVVHHDWEGYARQKNWGLRELPFESDWLLLLDADEVVTPELRSRIESIVKQPVNQVRQNGFFINRLTYFMGRPIRHCGYFPNWNMRLFKRGMGRFEDREVHEHVIIDDPVGYIRECILHDDRRGLEHYFAKHNRYSTLEAQATYREITQRIQPTSAVNIAFQTRVRRWAKRYIMPRVPFPGMWRFVYMYFLRLGFLDGRAGFQFAAFISEYDALVSLKLQELRQRARRGDRSLEMAAPALAQPEGSQGGDEPGAVLPQSVRNGEPLHLVPEPSPWSFREKLGRAIWMVFGKPVFRISFHNWYRFRASLLRLFGASIGKDVSIRPSVNVEVPWNLEVEDGATVGDHAILYSLGRIRIGKRAIVSQYAHLCAGTHDYADATFKLLRLPIMIGDDVWIGTDAFIGPGVTIGSLAVVGARSSVYKDMPAKQVCVGNPAKPIKERILR